MGSYLLDFLTDKISYLRKLEVLSSAAAARPVFYILLNNTAVHQGQRSVWASLIMNINIKDKDMSCIVSHTQKLNDGIINLTVV